MLGIQHASDWSNSAKLLNGKAAVKIQFDEKNEPFPAFFELVVTLIIKKIFFFFEPKRVRKRW